MLVRVATSEISQLAPELRPDLIPQPALQIGLDAEHPALDHPAVPVEPGVHQPQVSRDESTLFEAHRAFRDDHVSIHLALDGEVAVHEQHRAVDARPGLYDDVLLDVDVDPLALDFLERLRQGGEQARTREQTEEVQLELTEAPIHFCETLVGRGREQGAFDRFVEAGRQGGEPLAQRARGLPCLQGPGERTVLERNHIPEKAAPGYVQIIAPVVRAHDRVIHDHLAVPELNVQAALVCELEVKGRLLLRNRQLVGNDLSDLGEPRRRQRRSQCDVQERVLHSARRMLVHKDVPCFVYERGSCRGPRPPIPRVPRKKGLPLRRAEGSPTRSR